MMDLADVVGCWAGRATHRLDEVDSTQNEARRLAEAGAPEGTVVRAEHQTRGRGRLGRTWLDEPGSGLLVSIILRPHVDFPRFPQLSLVAAVAVAEAIHEMTALPVALAWPNDLLIHDRKVAGILAESVVPGDAGPVVILGIGVNVNQNRFPGELAARATSLALEAGRQFDRETLLGALRDRLERWYRRWATDGFEPVREAWRRRAGMLGQRVADNRGVVGIALDLGEDGALLVLTDGGGVARVLAGELTWGGEHATGG